MNPWLLTPVEIIYFAGRNMTTQIQRRIQETIEEIVRMDRVEEQLKVTRRELKEAQSEYKYLERNLRRGLKDIERLEGLSTKAIFHKILGNKEKQLEKERQEYLELSLKEEDVNNSIQLLEYEVNLLEAKIGSKNDLLKKLEKLKLEREEEIIKTNPGLRKKLLTISTHLENTFKYKVELNEALEAGEVCLNLMRQIIKHLSKVRNWGSWSGGTSKRGHYGRSMHRQAIDRARNLTYQIKHHLNIFANELNDLGKKIPFVVDTSTFSDFSDFFFNNIITDWILQQQLSGALGSANELTRNLNMYINELKKERDSVDGRIQKYHDQRDQILVS